MKKIYHSPGRVVLENLYFIQELTLTEIGKIYNVSYCTARLWALEAGIQPKSPKVRMTQRTKEKMSRSHKGKPHKAFTEEQRQNIRKSRLAWSEANAKRIRTKKSGYRVFTVGDKVGKFEHRVIMENFLERKLMPDEVVHHINGNKADNRIENLQVMTRAEHTRYHCLNRKLKNN